MLNGIFTAEHDRIIKELFPNCEYQESRRRINQPIVLQLDANRISGRKFVINDVEFIPEMDEFKKFNYVTLRKGEKVYKRCHWNIVNHLYGLWVDLDKCNF